MADDALSIKFTVSEEDVFRFQIYHTLRDRELQRALLVGALLLGGGTTYLLAVVEGDRWGTAIAAGLLVVLLFAGVYAWRLSRRASQWRQRSGGSAINQSVVIAADGVLWSVEGDNASLPWTAFQRIIGTPDYLAFYVGKRALNLIPRRAFASSEASEAFLQQAREWHAAAMAEPRT